MFGWWRRLKMRCDRGKIISLNVSEEKGTVKTPVERVDIDMNGVVGDAHAGAWHRQVSILAAEEIRAFSTEMETEIDFGAFAENITTEGVDLSGASLLDSFTAGGVELVVTQIGKKCHGDKCAIFQKIGKCVMPHKGIFCKVVNGGGLDVGDEISYTRRAFKFAVITLSDRASKGEYDDRSGPALRAIIEERFKGTNRVCEFSYHLIADDAEALKGLLEDAVRDGVDAVFTTGGTGVGPKDITPDVVTEFADKTIPGIMEHIRVKYGLEKPNALLSRSVAAVKGKMLIYTLPGSVKAVNEYTGEILKTLEHLVYMMHEIDTH
jgi:molybdenum cofactor synthesis domain-containing protein